mgnify:CR=1 FL=1
MEKEEFIKSKNIIISSIDKLNKELIDLKSKYIEANAKFKNGEKVLATHKDGVEKFLFVSSLSKVFCILSSSLYIGTTNVNVFIFFVSSCGN